MRQRANPHGYVLSHPARSAQVRSDRYKIRYKVSGRDACVFSPVTDVLVCAECGAVADDGDRWKAEIGMDDNDKSEPSSSASPAGPPSQRQRTGPREEVQHSAAGGMNAVE